MKMEVITMDEFDMDDAECVSDDDEVSESSALDEMLDITEDVSDYGNDEGFDYASLDEFPDVEEVIMDADNPSLDAIDEFYSAVPNETDDTDVSLADRELERMLAEYEEGTSDEEPEQKVFVKRWR